MVDLSSSLCSSLPEGINGKDDENMIKSDPQLSYMGVSENSVPLKPMVNYPYPYEKWLFHWEYTQHFQTNPYKNI